MSHPKQEHILELKAQGKSTREIAQITGVPKSTVHWIVARNWSPAQTQSPHGIAASQLIAEHPSLTLKIDLSVTLMPNPERKDLHGPLRRRTDPRTQSAGED